ncbi:MAG TPA: ABC transporter substrate-binding protein [Anaerolineales bacterium]|nr:ABC transporter substrate-binding protein [Anaerolineales bacterium]HND47031.1 ABC transporter substrate-binding protein [Anaerolineales bacterium]HNF94220.1 ABC transporter substrate-binding protein [Anaerolineales bacterium]
MLRNRMFALLGLLVIASMVLAACGAPAATTEEAAPATEAAAPATEAATAEPTPVPTTRHGGWLDEIAYSSVTADSAVTQITAGAIDIYTRGLASDRVQEIKDAGVCYAQSYGGYYDILFNPAVFTDTAKLNPFSNQKLREAMNWAIDRNYINQEIYGGGSLAKYTVFTTQLVDYTGVIETARGLESYYAYNFDQAKAVVDAEMPAMGAELVDGKWAFNGEPIVLAFLIRNDGDGTRLKIGDYFSDQLEKLGFTVDRQYRKSSEASPIWIGSDPKEGQWNLYTAGWVSSGLTRDEKTGFQDMYLPSSSQGIPLFLENASDPAFVEAGDALANGAFSTLEERRALIEKALPLSLKDSLQVWIVDQQVYSPYQCNVEATYDLGSGLEAAQMPPYNIRFKDQEGGQLKVGTNDLFTDPWNPVGGSNWVWDGFVQKATWSGSLMADPYTGLYWPLRAESADVTVQTGLPVITNTDWVTLNTADTIEVPADAWSDWDATAQTFVPAGEGVTAKAKIVMTYPADFFEVTKWHDGSNISVGDFVMRMIMTFDQAKPESAIYDEDSVPSYEAYKSTFKAVKIVSTDPLVIETYTDRFYSDAELIATAGDWWPQYGFGEASWHAIAMANAAEAAGETAYGTGKADRNAVEWTNFIGGPSLDLLNGQLDTLAAASTVPYAATLGQYVTADEAAARYANLKAFFEANGHFWSQTGPYYLASVDLNAKTALVKNNADFPDLSDRWASWSNPPLADATLDGPAQVKIGEATDFALTVTNKAGDAYPSSDIKQVKFLIYNDKGETIYVGEGVAGAGDGEYTLTIPADVQLQAGAGKIEAAVVLYPAAIPAFSALEFVAAP